MSIVAIDYCAMNNASETARKAARKCEDYINSINSKVTCRVSSLRLGGNGNTAQADYFARSKINALNQKKRQYETFANNMNSARMYASQIDEKVARYVRKSSLDFRNSHNMQVSVIVEFFSWVTTSVLNKTEFGRCLNQLFKEAGAWIDTQKRAFKEWYELEGGKYVIKTIGAVVAIAVAAVVLCIALPAFLSAVGAVLTAVSAVTIWGAVTMAAGVVTAVIEVANRIVEWTENLTAAITFKDDPGWAKRQSNITTVSDCLRKTNSNSASFNKWSMGAANAIDKIEIAAEMISITDYIRHGIKVVGRLKDIPMTGFSKVAFRSPKSGKASVGTIKYGGKNLIRNVKEWKKLFTSTNLSRLQDYHKKELGLEKFYKGLKRADKAMKFMESVGNKGTKKTLVENIKKKITGYSVSFKYHSDIENISEKITKYIKNKKPAYAN